MRADADRPPGADPAPGGSGSVEREVEAYAGRLACRLLAADVEAAARMRGVTCEVERHPRVLSVKVVFRLAGTPADVTEVVGEKVALGEAMSSGYPLPSG